MEAKVYLEWDDSQWQTALSKSASDRMGQACLVLERDIKSHFGTRQAPGVVTGRLKSSITSNWTDRRGGGKVGGWKPRAKNESPLWFGGVGSAVSNPGGGWPIIKGVVGTNVTYASGLEKGEGYRRPYPFLRPALERNRGNIERLFKGI